MLDNRRTIASRVEDALVEVRQALSGASLGDDKPFACLLRLRNALDYFARTVADGDTNDWQCEALGNAHLDAMQSVDAYGFVSLRDVVLAIRRMGVQHYRWEIEAEATP
jgi:hypothetical protein